ncbi:dihydroorotate dehydrogenase electron transfer subunit [Thermobifida fusca]|uniref:Dihydroorotate oxidase B, electron transfer subunit n=2 Tax=Thermobifida fusca TaxID=2021 RepID=A0A9P2TBD9_THEFU|nr:MULTISPECIES: dihydroorotate dehydrogenase electron transfer subunit [Thermobifida]AAZ55096.1 dihydroorotate oxidase B, electron transfer subunit [Thermobifida fusca YX]EOR71788.1 dihydroorotate oxidase B, electron transfer subunit [Thermobifida fusca TM51]MBO2528830.1 dihydroorotate dehydrogenase electron transfer subunit [Thermobifida sp.]PPS96074.1 dihydroorotate oxidase [Thermobifida fusca]PZN66139.1 MAG: dihydroorotate dehydrogenase electron transfer subunit [Thermobifida fusca]
MSDVRPVQMSSPVLTVRQVDAYHAITVVAPGIAERFRSGQFVAVAVGGEHSAMLTRRMFAIHEVKPDYGGTVEFLFTVRGKGTAWLAERRSRDLLDIIGPLGRPFPLPRDPVNCVLVGGGSGSVPLFPLAHALRRRGCRVDFVLGGATASRVFNAMTARRIAETATFTTDDGSLGTKGRVTDVLAQVIEEAYSDVVYACGPMPMLREVTAIAMHYGIPIQVSVEETMACGTGICMSCVVPVVGEDGITRMARACVDGPVFRGERVRFDDVGTVPFDALGAPGWKARSVEDQAREAG